MTADRLRDIEEAFDRYVSGFRGANDDLHPLLHLKLEHSACVASEMRLLSVALGWSGSEQNTAGALGQLHDIGRFSQFSEFGTFSDAVSVDHGERGWQVIREVEWSSLFPVAERDRILDGIRYHNQREVPADLPAKSLRFLRLVRDADKLDIFRVVLDAVERDGFRDLLTMIPNVTLDRSVSPQMLTEVTGRRTGSLRNVRTIGDFLVMLLSWVYDLNYAPTFNCIQERGILARALRQLEDTACVCALGKEVEAQVSKRVLASEPASESSALRRSLVGRRPGVLQALRQ